MSSSSHQTVSVSQFAAIFDAALQDYDQKTGTHLATHPLTTILEACDSPDAVLRVLNEQAHVFDQYRNGDWKVQLMRRLKPTVNILLGLSNSGVFGEGLALQFPPAKAIFASFGLLLVAAKGVSASHDALIDLFERFEHYLGRLKIFTELPSALGEVGEILVKIMVELLGVLALATQQIKQGRFKKLAKQLLGENDIEAVLQRLDRLTMEELQRTAAQTMQVVHGLFNNMKIVMDDGKAWANNIQRALVTMQQIVEDSNKAKRDQLQERVQKWLSPPDPSINHNFTCEVHHSGTATWFIKGAVYDEWKTKGLLLWLHGKPGSGKSVLCSSVIKDIEGIRVTGLASVAYYYCDYKDIGKQDRRGLLSSLLIQLCARSHRGYDNLSSLHATHDNGLRQPSESDLFRCLKDVLALRGQGQVYIIVDALDECPNSSGFPKTAREKVLDILEELVDLNLPDLRICVTSRPEIDIRIVLESLTSHHVSVHDEAGQKKDILDYVKHVVLTDRKMRRWRPEDKQLVIDTLSENADGMFRWIVCQLDILRTCFPASLRDALNDLPETLDETYERILLGIENKKREYAHRLLQCLTVSLRPLRVNELAEILAMRFDSERLPHYHVDWRLEDPTEAVLSACSSLIVIANVDGSQIVQFSHFSVKEFLTSDRLAEAAADLSHYQIAPLSAHTTIAQASLSVLLHLGDRVDKKMMEDFPFAFYAAQYWMVHGRFESVSSRIQDAMERLFDSDNPSFATWLWIYDVDYPLREHMFTVNPTSPEGVPLYYATLCGFRDLVEHLLAAHPGDVNASGGYYSTPFHAALAKGNLEIALLHLEHGTHVDALDSKGQSALHIASMSGRRDTVKFLLEHHADVNTEDSEGKTPLTAASSVGELEVATILVRDGAAVNRPQNDGRTPLYVASQCGHLGIAQFLIQSGAAVNSPQMDGSTPLHIASRYGYLDIVQLLTQSGAAVNAPQNDDRTPLYIASRNRNLGVVELLIQNGAAVDSPQVAGCAPLHIASRCGHLDIVQLLIQNGAAVNSRQTDGRTPLLMASGYGHLAVVRLLIQRGAAVDTHDNNGLTPLYTASTYGHLNIVRLLIQNGAAVDARRNEGWTPLMSASRKGQLDITQELLNEGANVNAQNNDLCTPLHLASANGHLSVAALLIQCNSEIDKQTTSGEIPLHQASNNGHLEIVQLLLKSGSNPNFEDSIGLTPLHLAARTGHLDIVKLLIESGGDIHARSVNNMTPFHLASANGRIELARYLAERSGGVKSWGDVVMAPIEPGSQNPPASVVPPSPSRKADVESPDNEKPSLHDACALANLDVVQSLLTSGADVNGRDETHKTPLCVASGNGRFEVAKLLIERGADVDLRDKYGWTALHRASRFGHPNVVRLLLDCSADVSAKEQDDWSALHLASANGYVDIVELLLGRGANVETRNDEGRTSFDEALRSGEAKIARILSQHG